MIDVTIILVSFNTKNYTKNTIDSILKNTEYLKYEIIVDENYIPMYRFSTKANDKYVVNTIKQGFREIHYRNLSIYWTYLSTTIPIKVLLQGDKAFAKTSMLNFVYSTNYNSYCNEHNKRNKT